MEFFSLYNIFYEGGVPYHQWTCRKMGITHIHPLGERQGKDVCTGFDERCSFVSKLCVLVPYFFG